MFPKGGMTKNMFQHNTTTPWAVGAAHLWQGMKITCWAVLVTLFAGVAGCGDTDDASPPEQDAAQTFVAQTSAELRTLWHKSALASWERATNITPGTRTIEADARARAMAAEAIAIRGAARFDPADTDPDTRRMLNILRTMSSAPAPNDADAIMDLVRVMDRMATIYGQARACDGDTCRIQAEASHVMATSNDPERLKTLWLAWHDAFASMRPLYERFVDLTGQGAAEIGFDDLGALWRSGYDMSPAAFEDEVARLWADVAPLYEQLHCHVRARLNDHYGDDASPPDGLIPAHLLGDLWAQSWTNVYDLAAPYPDQSRQTSPTDLATALRQEGHDARSMIRMGEDFFSSLGFDPLPDSFWDQSMITRPADRDVVCHASAWHMDFADDIRIKMCVTATFEDLVTIHHELGHVYYQRAYSHLPTLYQSGAHSGFHEAVGDAIALSMTPEYLESIGLVNRTQPTDERVMNSQMRLALEKVAFLPFALMVDQWRWDLFSGAVGPDRYNEAWWDMRRELQGIAPPVARDEGDFDAGAKYHVPANTSFIRYFLSTILQFQFHEALCDAAGWDGPLHDCSIRGSEAAGARLDAMMKLGQSKPWPDALEAITGSREMDAGALKRYFAPLRDWLETENAGRNCGW